MYRLGGFAVVAAAVYVSCYQPTFRDCEIACTAQSGCPDGLACDTGAGRCALNGICAPGDGPPGGFMDAPAHDASSACWTYTPTNYMPCMPGFPSPGTFNSSSTPSIDTASAACSYGSGDVCLYHVMSLDITSPLVVHGPRPLIFVSDQDINVTASITFDGAVMTGGTSCNAAAVGNAAKLGAGGGGGGYGAPGAPGGAGSGVSAPGGGSAFGSGSLEPLFPGCPGATGGTAGTVTTGGKAGAGGGGLELSAKGIVRVMAGGVVSADGSGGGAGVGSGSAAASGGGGGGTGGAVLLEGVMITVAGSVCAVAGAGGDGGPLGSGTTPAGGNGSGCVRGVGDSPGIGGGGNGGGSSSPGAGTPAGTVIAGGGGGGAIGRIRIRSVMSTANTSGSTIVPMPVTQ